MALRVLFELHVHEDLSPNFSPELRIHCRCQHGPQPGPTLQRCGTTRSESPDFRALQQPSRLGGAQGSGHLRPRDTKYMLLGCCTLHPRALGPKPCVSEASCHVLAGLGTASAARYSGRLSATLHGTGA